MKYLCLAYGNEEKFESLSKSDLEDLGAKCKTHDEDLHRGGHLVLIGSLQPSRATTTLRPRNGRTSVLDGPYAETREQVGGFFILEARDLNEAIAVASRHPAARLGEDLGCVLEVRPIDFWEEPGKP